MFMCGGPNDLDAALHSVGADLAATSVSTRTVECG
jgi:hypothetical protein